jgi:hypothetical protein
LICDQQHQLVASDSIYACVSAVVYCRTVLGSPRQLSSCGERGWTYNKAGGARLIVDRSKVLQHLLLRLHKWPRDTVIGGVSPQLVLRKNGPFECLPYVCPQPVLVKCPFLYINGAKSGVYNHPAPKRREEHGHGGFSQPHALLRQGSDRKRCGKRGVSVQQRVECEEGGAIAAPVPHVVGRGRAQRLRQPPFVSANYLHTSYLEPVLTN